MVAAIIQGLHKNRPKLPKKQPPRPTPVECFYKDSSLGKYADKLPIWVINNSVGVDVKHLMKLSSEKDKKLYLKQIDAQLLEVVDYIERALKDVTICSDERCFLEKFEKEIFAKLKKIDSLKNKDTSPKKKVSVSVHASPSRSSVPSPSSSTPSPLSPKPSKLNISALKKEEQKLLQRLKDDKRHSSILQADLKAVRIRLEELQQLTPLQGTNKVPRSYVGAIPRTEKTKESVLSGTATPVMKPSNKLKNEGVDPNILTQKLGQLQQEPEETFFGSIYSFLENSINTSITGIRSLFC